MFQKLKCHVESLVHAHTHETLIHTDHYSLLFNYLKINKTQIKLISDSIKDTCCCDRQVLSIITPKILHTSSSSSRWETKIVQRWDRKRCDRGGGEDLLFQRDSSLFLSAPSLSCDTIFPGLMSLKTPSFTFNWKAVASLDRLREKRVLLIITHQVSVCRR